MNNELIFIRHANTKIDKDVPIEDWVLTEEGQEKAEELANSGEFDEGDILICSNEDKSYLTIKPLAEKLQKEIIRVEDLGEIKRPDSQMLTTEEYKEMKIKIFQNLDFTEHDWETANHALNRFKEAIENIDKEYDAKKIILCSHGTVLTIYFAYLQNKMNELMTRWKNLDFGNYGIVKDNKIVRDIV